MPVVDLADDSSLVFMFRVLSPVSLLDIQYIKQTAG